MRQNLVLILLGLAAIAVGVYEFYDLMAMEAQGGSRKVHTLVKLAYEAGGKYAVLGVFGAVGLGFLGFGAFKIARRPRSTAQAA